MMRRLRLNMYRAEDALFLMRKHQWEKEDAEFAKEQARRKKEGHQRRIKKNRERRLKIEAQEKEKRTKQIEEERKIDEEDRKLATSLKIQFCCGNMMRPPIAIFQ